MTEPTPAELDRARRYIESVPFDVAEFPTGNWIVKGGPALFRHVWGPTRDDAVASLLNAVVEVLASVGPLIREECAVKVENAHPSEKQHAIAAAIRAMSQ